MRRLLILHPVCPRVERRHKQVRVRLSRTSKIRKSAQLMFLKGLQTTYQTPWRLANRKGAFRIITASARAKALSEGPVEPNKKYRFMEAGSF